MRSDYPGDYHLQLRRVNGELLVVGEFVQEEARETREAPRHKRSERFAVERLGAAGEHVWGYAYDLGADWARLLGPAASVQGDGRVHMAARRFAWLSFEHLDGLLWEHGATEFETLFCRAFARGFASAGEEEEVEVPF